MAKGSLYDFTSGSIDARYVKGGHRYGAPLKDEDEEWINLIFSWCGWPYDPGQWFAAGLRGAVKARLMGWHQFAWSEYHRTATSFQFIGFGHHYITSLRGIALKILQTGELPFEIISWDCESDQGPPVPIVRPLPAGKDVSADQADAIAELVKDVAKAPPPAYLESRKPEIAAVKGMIARGELKLSEAPELAQTAVIRKRELKAAEEMGALEMETLENKVATRELERDQAVADFLAAGGKPEQLSGILSKVKKEWKRIRKKVKRVASSVATPLARIRSEISYAVLPKAVRQFGYQVEKEASRLGRRVNKEIIRGMEQIATQAPWLKIVATVLGFLIPVFGPLIHLLTIAGVATVEIAWVIRQKQKLDESLSAARKLLNQQLQALDAQIVEIQRLTAELQAQRLLLVDLGLKAQNRRLTIAASVLTEQEQRKKRALLLATGATAAGLILSRNPIFALAPVAGYLLWARKESKRGPLASYDACVVEGGVPEDCRDDWMLEQVERLDLAPLEELAFPQLPGLRPDVEVA